MVGSSRLGRWRWSAEVAFARGRRWPAAVAMLVSMITGLVGGGLIVVHVGVRVMPLAIIVAMFAVSLGAMAVTIWNQRSMRRLADPAILAWRLAQQPRLVAERVRANVADWHGHGRSELTLFIFERWITDAREALMLPGTMAAIRAATHHAQMRALEAASSPGQGMLLEV